MPTNTTVLVLVAALAVFALAGVVVWVTYKTRAPQRHPTDTTIRDKADQNARRVRRQHALADEYAARIQAAEIEIEVRTLRACGRDTNRMSIAARRAPPALH
ncbi:hypothetical protein Mycsm_00771 [Mycobacterium sp. JS623]|uniref:hypothetical protein n=1 Tax=Mycobacterium sp. JS623 TaxID=212767 RepID=UPI0002A56B72|nr:hypothetical protein [Mycobacterium sp. JS623]AGB21211.1 hypothetical protein Mycsm_00771 [Mycobacterium sp. JS623]